MGSEGEPFPLNDDDNNESMVTTAAARCICYL